MQVDEIRSQQRESWNKFSKGWKKWDDLTMNFLHSVGKEMLNSIPWKETYQVLDIACGTGEPGITAATIVKKGSVTATDLAEDMIAIAAENAAAKGIKNYKTRICSADDLPFDDNSFDVILCRMGFMFFPDILKAAKEIYRVLNPGGIITTSVWSDPKKNPWATAIMAIIRKYADIPAPDPNVPGLFRCAEYGYLTNYFKQAGFRNINEKIVDFQLKVDSIETYWDWNTEVAAPVVSGLNKVDEVTKEKIKKEVFEEASKYKKDASVSLPASAVVITAQK
jgi:ubiquinone/menaquinone biosynthesis C-methylase UbiE